jgi:hypothetical protein
MNASGEFLGDVHVGSSGGQCDRSSQFTKYPDRTHIVEK